MDWKAFRVGQHLKFDCGCQGYIAEVRTEGSSKEGQTGFLVKYTFNRCGQDSRWGLRNSYSDGYGPYGNFFNYGDEEEYATAAIESPAPSWWKKFEDGPDRKLQNLKRERWRKYQAKQKLAKVT